MNNHYRIMKLIILLLRLTTIRRKWGRTKIKTFSNFRSLMTSSTGSGPIFREKSSSTTFVNSAYIDNSVKFSKNKKNHLTASSPGKSWQSNSRSWLVLPTNERWGLHVNVKTFQLCLVIFLPNFVSKIWEGAAVSWNGSGLKKWHLGLCQV